VSSEAFARATASSAFSVAFSSARARRAASITQSESQIARFEAPKNRFNPRFFRPYPALLGRQVNWGFRQSTPSSMQAI
jgi:hypothetical protein